MCRPPAKQRCDTRAYSEGRNRRPTRLTRRPGPAVQLAAGRARGGEKLTGDVAGGDQYGLGTPQRPVGWQPPGVAPPVTSLEGTAKGKVGPGSETRMPKPGLVHTSRG